mmetsp:Transcript_32168/g.47527  ORF Transcript_32168/g.47527 Transcript_32168/m.47527 type:complete len:101 (+) Transcript_32168:4161-4463(+)
MNGKPIFSNVQHQVKHSHYDQQLRNAIIKKEQWNDTLFDTVCWHFFDKAMHHSTTLRCHNFSRVIHRLWPTNDVLAKRSPNGNQHDCRCKHSCNTVATET